MVLRQDDTLSDTLLESPWPIKLDLIVAKHEASVDWGWVIDQSVVAQCLREEDPYRGRGYGFLPLAGGSTSGNQCILGQ